MITLEELYRTHKAFLTALAYRMLSSVMDAEDIVHNVFLSLDAAAVRQLHNPRAYLCRLVTNRCIDHLRSARVRREAYAGPWLPEPWIEPYQHENGSPENDPLRRAVMNETLSTAFLLLLETLSPVERAVYVLREAYDLDYEDVAEATGKSPANCRQMYRRAKLKLDSARGEHAAESGVRHLEETKAGALVERFILALGTGNVELLSSLLAAGVTSVTDGGGKVQAAIRPIIGRDRVIAFLTGIVKKAPMDLRVQPCVVNGRPGLVSYAGGAMINAISFRFEGECIGDIYLVSNPDKLRAASIEFQ